jgi:hypothetical protein
VRIPSSPPENTANTNTGAIMSDTHIKEHVDITALQAEIAKLRALNSFQAQEIRVLREAKAHAEAERQQIYQLLQAAGEDEWITKQQMIDQASQDIEALTKLEISLGQNLLSVQEWVRKKKEVEDLKAAFKILQPEKSDISGTSIRADMNTQVQDALIHGNAPRAKRNFTPLGMTLTEAFERLVASGHLAPIGPTTAPPPEFRRPGWNPDANCEFHRGRGHTTENCWKLKHTIQDLIDAGVKRNCPRLPAIICSDSATILCRKKLKKSRHGENNQGHHDYPTT